jgi:hypothetical protein
MIKNFIIFGLFLALAISINFPIVETAEVKECVKEPYEQNQMVGGCVMQKTGGRWIRTCG